MHTYIHIHLPIMIPCIFNCWEISTDGSKYCIFFRTLVSRNNLRSIPSHRNYTSVQILNNMFNEIWRNSAMPAVIGMLIMVEIIACYTLISSMGELPTPIATLFCIVAFDIFVVIQLLLKFCSYPFTKSCEFISSLRAYWGHSKFVMKWAAACQPTKIGITYDGVHTKP